MTGRCRQNVAKRDVAEPFVQLILQQGQEMSFVVNTKTQNTFCQIDFLLFYVGKVFWALDNEKSRFQRYL